MLERPATRKGLISRPTAAVFPCARSSGAKIFSANLFRSCIGLTILLLASACAAPLIQHRPVQAEATWFVRLDSVEPSERPPVQHQHPAHWSEQDLFAILSKLFLEQRVGMMDEPKPVREVFSVEELQQILPGMRAAFQQALPHEWVAFTIIEHNDTEDRTVTSGGLFQAADRLHIVIANHRTLLQKNSKELVKIQNNPLHSVNGSGGVLGIEPRRFVLTTKANWSGGHQASASELILDHGAFLSSLQRTGSATAPVPVRGSHVFATAPEPDAARSGSSHSVQVDSEQIIFRLREEIERLKQQLADQASEVDRLKRREFRSTPTP